MDVEGAAQVIGWLEQLLQRSTPRRRHAAGTAGRRGYPEQRRVQPNAAAWGALWSTARGLGMDRDRLERFIATHYSGVGLHGLDDLHTMADLPRSVGPEGHAASRFARQACHQAQSRLTCLAWCYPMRCSPEIRPPWGE